METLWQDIKYGARMLARNPGFTALVVLTLALGIGANTAIFSVVNAVLLQPFPYPEPGRIVRVWEPLQRHTGVERFPASYADFLDWQRMNTVFSDLAAHADGRFTLTGFDEPERLRAEFVSASYFRVFGIQPILGRTFLPGDEKLGTSQPVVVIGEGLWRRRFGGDPQVIGKTIELSERQWTILGVLPASFRGASDKAEIWAPSIGQWSQETIMMRGNMWLEVYGRLKPGVTLAQAQANMEAIARQLALEYPKTNSQRGAEVITLGEDLFGDLRPALLVLLSGVGVLLLIACVNVTNLLLVRAEARQREIAIRSALGATRTRLLRQLVTEALLLAVMGAAFGVVLASWGSDALLALKPVELPSYVAVRMDRAVMAFTVCISLLTGILLGLAPAWHALRSNVSRGLKETGRASAGNRSQRLRGILVATEVALAAVLLVSAGLLARTLRNIATLHPGFDANRLLVLRTRLPRKFVSDEEAAALYAQAIQGVRDLPGVREVGLSGDVPLDDDENATAYVVEGQSIEDEKLVQRTFIHQVSPGFFATMGIPLLAGRDVAFSEISRDARVAVVSAFFARHNWPGENPIGKRFQLIGDKTLTEVVGLVPDILFRRLPRNPDADPDIYLPQWSQALAVSVRTEGDPRSLTAAVSAVIRRISPQAPVYDVRTMDERVAREMARSRFTGVLMSFFSATALLLALVGIYGVTSYAVSQRTREIGIRMALGAQRGDVLQLILSRGLAMAAGGVAAGIVAAFAVTRFEDSLLFGISAADPATFAGVAVLLSSVALLACYVPAQRAARVDPMVALRYE